MIAIASVIFLVGPVEVPSAFSRALPPFSSALSWVLANTFILTAVVVGLAALTRLLPVRSRLRHTLRGVRWMGRGSAPWSSSSRRVNKDRQRHTGGEAPIPVVVGVGHVELPVSSPDRSGSPSLVLPG